MSTRSPDPDSLRYARHWEPVLAGPARRTLDRITPAPDTFLDLAKTFRPKTKAELASIKERRLRIAKARRGETLRRLLERTNAALSPAQAAVGNDMEMDTPLTDGQLVKIVVEQPYSEVGR